VPAPAPSGPSFPRHSSAFRFLFFFWLHPVFVSPPGRSLFAFLAARLRIFPFFLTGFASSSFDSSLIPPILSPPFLWSSIRFSHIFRDHFSYHRVTDPLPFPSLPQRHSIDLLPFCSPPGLLIRERVSLVFFLADPDCNVLRSFFCRCLFLVGTPSPSSPPTLTSVSFRRAIFPLYAFLPHFSRPLVVPPPFLL